MTDTTEGLIVHLGVNSLSSLFPVVGEDDDEIRLLVNEVIVGRDEITLIATMSHIAVPLHRPIGDRRVVDAVTRHQVKVAPLGEPWPE